MSPAPENNAAHQDRFRLVQYRVTGRVQGVGFRAFVQRCGRQLGLNGIVRNLPDGSVESLVRFATDPAPENQQRRADFEDRLRQGPPHSKVDGVQSQALPDSAASAIGPGFQIV